MTSKSALRENLESLVFPMILVLITRTFIFQAFKIPSASMEDTLLIGDHILVNKAIYYPPIPGLDISLFPTRDPQRGDIMVFKFPNDPAKDYIKRLVGVGNDHIAISRPFVTINGQLQDENRFTKHERQVGPSRDGEYKVPPDQFFMMGDNRDNSEDSRVWGFLKRERIKGKAFVIYFSLDLREMDAAMSRGPAWLAPWYFLKSIRWRRTFNLLH